MATEVLRIGWSCYCFYKELNALTKEWETKVLIKQVKQRGYCANFGKVNMQNTKNYENGNNWHIKTIKIS